MQDFYFSNIWVASEYITKNFKTCGSLDTDRNNLVSKDTTSMQVSLSSWMNLAVLRIKLHVNTDMAFK